MSARALAVVLLLLAACDEGRVEQAVDALNNGFPSQAAQVLGQDSGVRARLTSSGWLLERSSPVVEPTAGGLRARFPRRAGDAIHFSTPDGFWVRAREEGLAGRAALAGPEGRALAYPRTGGTSYWHATGDGFEEWLHVIAPGSGPVARWFIEGAKPKQTPGGVDLLDESGRARISVAAPLAFARDGRRVGVRLTADGSALVLHVDAKNEEVLVDPAWRVTGSALQGRDELSMVQLQNGKVLTIGGDNGSATATCELYDPASASWASTGSMSVPRFFHAAVVLRSGKVLVAGGKINGSTKVATAELYDPATGTWSATGSMAFTRERHTLTLLNDGRVLVAGDFNGEQSVETYDPSSGTWTTHGSLSIWRGEHAAARLQDGRVLIAGGTRNSGSSWNNTAEIFNPATNTLSATGTMNNVRSSFSLTVLSDGKVLAVGGRVASASATATAETFDPATGLWTATAGNLPTVRQSHTATLLQNGRVLIAGGCNDPCAAVANTETYDPATRTFTAGSALPGGVRRRHGAVMMPDGQLLIAGGAKNTAPTELATAEVYDPSTPAWSNTTAIPVARDRHTTTLMPNGQVLVAGGNFGAAIEQSAYRFNPSGGTWTATPNLNVGRHWHTATLLNDDKVLVVGGRNTGNTSLTSAELYDPVANSWTSTGALSQARREHAAVLLSDGRVLVTGGTTDGSVVLGVTEIYDPAAGTWSTTGSMAQGRKSLRALLLPNGKVLAGPGFGPGNSEVTFELWDPATGQWSAAASSTGHFADGALALLPNGRVLAAGGCCNAGTAEHRAQIYNPASNTWTSAGNLPAGRMSFAVGLMPNGRVVIAGGDDFSASVAATSFYEPITNAFVAGPNLGTIRRLFSGTLLPDGRYIVVGGIVSGSTDAVQVELLDLGLGTLSAVRPTISGSLPTSNAGGALSVTGTVFTGVSESSHGGFNSSPNNMPLFALTRQDNGQVSYAQVTDWTATSMNVSLPASLHSGWHWARVIVNGVWSNASPILISSVGAPDRVAFVTQPTNAVAGQSISPAVQVAIQDGSGNTVTSSSAAVTLAIGNDAGPGGTLSGTLTVNAVNGIATFSNLSINRTGVGYTLNATSTGLTNQVSSAFNITPGTPSRVAFTAQPSNTVAGQSISPAVQVTVQDPNGNTVTSSSAAVTVAIQNDAGPGGVLGGTLTVNAVNGVATFSNLSINRTGTGYTLSAASSALTGATSSAFNITPGAANRVVFTAQPSNTVAGQSISPAVQVTVQDLNGNTVTGSSAAVTIGFGNNAGGSTLGGTLTVNAVSGVATFSNLSLNRAANGYTLTATATGLTGATSSAFNITPGAASRLGFLGSINNAVAGASLSPAVQVAVQDANGNTVTSSSASITVAIGNNPGPSTLGGTLTLSAVSGVASFSNLSLDVAATGYTLVASAPSLTGGTSNAFDVLPASASRLAFTAQPVNGTAGQALAAFQVTVQDNLGNTVTGSSASITIGFATNPGGGNLSGTLTVNAVSGVATFSTITLDRAATGYQLSASASGMVGATSAAFAIGPAAADHLTFIVQPSSATAGVAIAPAMQVAIEDAFGNRVTGSSATVTLQLETNPGGSTPSGTTQVAASSGLASFSNFSLNRVGIGYSLRATSGGLTAAVSAPFNVGPGAAAQLAFTAQPSNTPAGQVMSPAVQVAVRDALGNLVSSSTAPVTLALVPHASGAMLSGTTMRSASGGLASFDDLTLNRVGTAMTLSATSSGLSGATSGPFDVLAGPPVALVFSTPARTVPAGQCSAAITVEAQDADGNPAVLGAALALTLQASAQTAMLFSDPGCTSALSSSSFFPGAPTVTAYLLDTVAGQVDLAASATGLTSTTQTQTVTGGAAAVLEVSGFPSPTQAGQQASFVVTARDAYGNRASAFLGPVDFSSTDLAAELPQGEAFGATDSGQKTLQARLVTAGTQSLTATSANLTGEQTGIVVAAAAASRFVVYGVPSPIFAGTPADVTVEARDAFDNLASAYLGTARLGSSDAFAALPLPVTFQSANAGRVTLTQAVRLRTGGTHSVIATDTVDATITGAQTGIVVDPNTPPRITRDANTKAAVGEPYLYNALGRVDAFGAGPVTFDSCGTPLVVEASTGAVRWTPSTPGSTPVCVRATNAFGEDRYDFVIDVVARVATPVQADFIATPASGAAPLLVAFDASGSSADPSALPMMFRWSFGDGSPLQTGQSRSHLYTVAGGYQAKLTAFDAYGASATASQTILVTGPNGEVPPTARIVASSLRGRNALDVSFSCDCQSGSSPIAGYVWELGNGQQASGPTASATYNPGRYQVRLTVVDAAGLGATDSVEVVVTSGDTEPPLCVAAAEPTSGDVPFSTLWTGYAAPGSANLSTRRWQLPGPELVDGDVVPRTYAQSGHYVGTFRVEDELGLACEQSVWVMATANGQVPPRIVSAPLTQAWCGVPYQYSVEGTAFAIGAAPVQWQLLEGPEGMQVDEATGEVRWTPSRAAVGVHPVRLQATNAGGSDVRAFEVEVVCGDAVKLGVGCGCRTAEGLAGWWFLASLLAFRARRRRSSRSYP